jgi:sugar phosphate isomerase/epimerase
MLDRRTFLVAAGRAAAAAAAGFGLAPRRATGRPLRSLERIGLQLYTVRAEMERDLEETLQRVREIGYGEVEFAGYFGRSPAAVRAALGAAGLDAPAAHVGFDTLGDLWRETLEAAATVGHRWVVVPWIPEPARTDLDGYRRVAERFNRAGEAAREVGLSFAYHNHDFEFEPESERVPFDVLLEETDPALVAFELDVYWAVRGGADPVECFARFPGRFPLAHLKDMDAEGRMVDVGAGRIDFRSILRERDLAGLRHAFVEHDEPPDPLASARVGYDHLAALFR